MALPVWMDNLFAYCLQMAILAAAGTLLAYIFRLRIPRISLYYWQVLLIACLALPLLQKWDRPAAVSTDIPIQMAEMTVPNTGTEVVSSPPSSPKISTTDAVVLVFAAGALLRLFWLALGFYRLRLLLRRSEPIDRMPPVAERVSSLTGVRARFYLSDETDNPATFGIFNPTVILPRTFLDMREACREAVLCHELLHVRRRDWALIFIEEMIRTLFWFHPAVWWLLSRIHLTREQSVDHEVVRLTGNRQPYLDSLLEIARKRGRPRAVPAPLFLRERHLVERVALLIKEVSMNRLRLALSLVAVIALLAGTVHFAAAWFPLTGTADPAMNPPSQNPLRISENDLQSKLIHRVPAEYPEDAKEARITGEVRLDVTVNEEGNVADVSVLRGHPLLIDSAVEAVKQWKYEPTLLNGTPIPVISTVTIGHGFVMPTIIERNPPPGSPQRIGSNVLQSKLIHQVPPEYPDLAKRARVQGSVVLQITVDEEGNVTSLVVAQGHPMLIDAAVEAVKQWKYEPTLLNGTPIPVIATVTVNFRLSGDSISEVQTGVPLHPGTHRTVMLHTSNNGAIGYSAGPVDKGQPPSSVYQLPILSLNSELLLAIAHEEWPADMNVEQSIVYLAVIDQSYEIKELRHLRGPEIPRIEDELYRTPVLQPGMYDYKPEAYECIIEIKLSK